MPSFTDDHSAAWSLDPDVAYLNHGSFGACLTSVLTEQREWCERIERHPVRFFSRELEGALDAAREEVARFVGSKPEDLAFVPNATSGINTVLRSLSLAPGDEILTTNHSYNAAMTSLQFAAGRSGAQVVVAEVPFPLTSDQHVVEAMLERVTPRTRLALIDHVTSPTGLVLPVKRLVFELRERGIETFVDGAHAPGMLDLDLDGLGAAYYTGNCHKWLCTPKGAALLHVRSDKQEQVRPLQISHGANATRTDRSRFRLEFDWTGTADPSAYLVVPSAIRALGEMLPGGWPELRKRNRGLALAARDLLTQALGTEEPAPDAMIGFLATVPLPDSPSPEEPFAGPLQTALAQRHRIEVPVFPFPAFPRRALRISVQLYNTLPQYEALASALPGLLAEGL